MRYCTSHASAYVRLLGLRSSTTAGCPRMCLSRFCDPTSDANDGRAQRWEWQWPRRVSAVSGVLAGRNGSRASVAGHFPCRTACVDGGGVVFPVHLSAAVWLSRRARAFESHVDERGECVNAVAGGSLCGADEKGGDYDAAMAERDCVQCSAETRGGRRCRRRTCVTAGCCWQHSRAATGFAVRDSAVAGAGCPRSWVV